MHLLKLERCIQLASQLKTYRAYRSRRQPSHIQQEQRYEYVGVWFKHIPSHYSRLAACWHLAGMLAVVAKYQAFRKFLGIWLSSTYTVTVPLKFPGNSHPTKQITSITRHLPAADLRSPTASSQAQFLKISLFFFGHHKLPVSNKIRREYNFSISGLSLIDSYWGQIIGMLNF